MGWQNKMSFRNLPRESILWVVFVLFSPLLMASSKALPPDFYQQVDRFLVSPQITSETLVQEAHHIVKRLVEATENREDFIQKVKVLKSYLRLVCDFTQQQTFQRTLLLEEEINTHVTSWNEEVKHKRSTITWSAIGLGALVGLLVAVTRATQENRLDLTRFQEIGINFLIWAPISVGGGLSLGSLVAEQEVEQRQVLLIHPTELVKKYSGDVPMYKIESHLKAFLGAKEGPFRSQAQKKLQALHSKAPEKVEGRIRYMQAVLAHAPGELIPSQKAQQDRLAVLEEVLSLQFPSQSPSSWDEIRSFLSHHLYGFAVTGAILGVIIFLLPLHLSGGWSWPYAALSFVIGLRVGFALGQMAGELIKIERPDEILHHEVFF
ncbi:hypothetical protein [Nitrosococcus wardiae]|uniref:Uncharacterized protein n=1 Tax=Nitrosococcus wardiae TaxID=1814290 RepID=A0A4P7C1Y7_9GAMM|nr:hypothetical protein [Nitrosococcus wardiae]QBQ55709.1 hypothetical protein E3U44_15220 [Nitrosococcus wardiae]